MDSSSSKLYDVHEISLPSGSIMGSCVFNNTLIIIQDEIKSNSTYTQRPFERDLESVTSNISNASALLHELNNIVGQMKDDPNIADKIRNSEIINNLSSENFNFENNK